MQRTRGQFTHHRLEVYGLARRLVQLVHRRGPGNAELRGQARRASVSVALNVAEGAAMEGAARKQFFRRARASAVEVVAAFEIASDIGERVPVAEVSELASPIVGALTKLAR